MSNEIRIKLSWGLVLLAIIHAAAFGMLSYGLHPKKAAMPADQGWELPSHYSGDQIGAHKFQALENVPPVNANATHEIKEQNCINGQCYPQSTSQLRPGAVINGERVLAVGPSRTIPQVTTVSNSQSLDECSQLAKRYGANVVEATDFAANTRAGYARIRDEGTVWRTSGKAMTKTVQASTMTEVRRLLAAEMKPGVIAAGQPASPDAEFSETVPTDRLIYPSQPRSTPEAQPAKKNFELALFIDGSTQAQQLVEWFNTDPQLLKIRNQCNFQIYTRDNGLYQTRYSDIVPVDQFPVVLFQDSTGGHIHAAGRAMIPTTPSELYSDLGEGYTLYKQAKQGNIQQTGALIAKGYSWDDSITPTMQLSEQDCPDGYCPTPDASWRPFDRVRPNRDGGSLFDGLPSKNAFVWANVNELATIGLFVIAAFLGFYIMTRRSN